MEPDKAAVGAKSDDRLASLPQLDRPVGVDKLDESVKTRDEKFRATCLAGFRRSFVIKRRFVPITLSRFLWRFR